MPKIIAWAIDAHGDREGEAATFELSDFFEAYEVEVETRYGFARVITDTGEVTGPLTWSDLVAPECMECGRPFRLSVQVAEAQREEMEDFFAASLQAGPPPTDAEVAASLDLCLACTGYPVPGEHLIPGRVPLPPVTASDLR